MVHEACAAFIVAPVTVIDPALVLTAPAPLGQVEAMLGAPATVTPAGNVSVKLTPASAGLPAPLVSVNVSVDTPPRSMNTGENAFVRAGCNTVTVWSVTPFVIPEIAVICAAPLTLAPSVVPRTVSVMVH